MKESKTVPIWWNENSQRKWHIFPSDKRWKYFICSG